MAEKNNKNKYQYLEKSALIVIIFVASILILMLVFTDAFSGNSKKDAGIKQPGGEDSGEISPTYLNQSRTDSDMPTSSENPTQTEENKVNDTVYEKKTFGNELVGRGNLVLVNNSFPFTMPNGYESEFLTVYEEYGSKNYGFTSGEELLLPEAAKALNNMLTDFKSSTGLDDIILHYCYVNYETQERYYNNQVKALGEQTASVWTKRAGCSEHHTGLAFNLNVSHSGGSVGDGTYKWITDHCAEYGVIRRFPESKQTITYEKNELNHFRYVGVPHAVYMQQNDLCLEEYIEFVKKYSAKNPLYVNVGNDVYYVYYTPADTSASSTEIYVPKDKEYDVSGNNCSGFVISYKG